MSKKWQAVLHSILSGLQIYVQVGHPHPDIGVLLAVIQAAVGTFLQEDKGDKSDGPRTNERISSKLAQESHGADGKLGL